MSKKGPTMKKSLGLLLALSAALACGKSDSEKFADDYCAEVAKCCAEAKLPGDGATCRMLMSFASAGSSFNTQAGDACLADMRSQVSAGTFCAELGTSACDAVFDSGSGNKKPGETCDFDDECAPSSEGDVKCASVSVDGAFIDKCQVQIPGKAGDSPCVGTKDGSMTMYYHTSNATDVLPRGYICDMANGLRCKDGTCTALPKVGEACDYVNDCVRDAYCDYAADKCAARIPAGGACSGSNSDECVEGYYCDKQCVAKLDNGASCTSGSVCKSGSCANGACSGNFGLSLMCGGS
jgi:hypothetical protein